MYLLQLAKPARLVNDAGAAYHHPNLIPLTLLICLVAQPAGAGTLSLPTAPETLDLSDRTVVFSIDDGYHSVYKYVYPLLKRHRMPMTLGLICNSITTGRASYQSGDRFLNRAEIREMIDSLDIEIASHTLSHPWLTRIDSAAAWKEISTSKSFLESLFGRPVLTLVYPYGDVNERVIEMTRAAGYRMGRAVRAGTVDLWTSPYRVPEVELRMETGLATVKRHIRRNEVTVLLLHRIVPEPRVFTEWPVAEFAELVGWLARGGARVTTLAGLHDDWRRERLARTVLLQLEIAREQGANRLFEDVDVDATRTAHPGR
jgi:peptidoglycan/xylan/chitin deacetylase (PgdA/CDA1 family)